MEKLKWETKKVKVKDLIQLDINPRKISEQKKQKLIDSLEKFNLVEIPAVNTDMQIIGGNQRVTALMLVGRGDEKIDVRMPNRKLTKKEVKEYAIISNTHAGEFDFEILDLEFADISMGELGFEINGWDDWKNKQDTLLAGEAQEDDFDVPVGGSETDIVLGDLFEIGGHRLLCGDSTDSDQVAKLMNGKKADMVFTDPPYLMDFKGGIHDGGRKSFNSKHGGILNDKMSKSDGEDFLDAINSNIILFCKGAFYITFYRLGIDKYYQSLNRVGLKCRSLIIWNKGNHTLSNSDYMSRYEPIFYGWVDEHNFYGGNNGMDIWDIERTKKNELHPTMKPVALCEKAINDASKKEDKILDLFLGSGSTMVASHQLNRKCYGMELDPKYCQVIIDRMIKLDPSLKITKNGKEWNTTKIS